MSNGNMLVAIDVGTHKICTLIGQFTPEGLIHIIGVGQSPSKGARRGVIVTVDEAAQAIAHSVEQAERMAGYPVKSAFIGIAGSHIASLNSKGVIAVSRADGEISHDDVNRAIDAAQAISLPANREILHVLPRSFVIDGQEGVKDPVGMSGVRLEVETHIVSCATSSLRNLVKCVNQVGIDVEGLVLNCLASAQSVLTETDKELGCILVDIGAGTTDIAIFVEGSVWYTGVLPVGGNHVTNDIAVGLRIPFHVAERIKNEVYSTQNTEEDIDLINYGSTEKQLVSRQLLKDIVHARLEEIFAMLSAEIRKSGYVGLLSGGAILTGGGAEMDGIVDIAKQYLKIPTRIGIPMKISGMIDKIKTPAYTTGAGLLLWGQHHQFLQVRKRSSSGNWPDVFKQFRDWIKRSFSV
ncbi:MAG: cell division protein FtsA [bacterium]